MSTPSPPGPPPAPPPPAYQPPTQPPYGGPDPRQAVNAPAIAIIVAISIGMALGLLGIVMNLAGMGFGAGMGDMGGADTPEWLAPLVSGTVSIITSLIGIAIGAFIIYAMLQMRQLKSWGMAMAASIIAMVPCISPCCILGIPFGIWALVILNKPEVKAAFT